MKSVLKFFVPRKMRVVLCIILNQIKNYYLYFIFHINKANKYFDFNGGKFKYFSALYNSTFQNERAVEIPIMLDYIKKNKNKNILEIGNVLSHYFKTDYDVVDKYEKGIGVSNCDIIDFVPTNKYDLIISISTFEHIGFDEVQRYSNDKNLNIQPDDLLRAIEKAKSLLNPNGIFIFSAPIGFNSFLDSQLKNNYLGLTEILFLKRISSNNNWIQAQYADVQEIQYGQPYACANALIIGIFKNI